MVLNHGRHLPEPIYYNLILTQLNDLFNVQKRVLSLARFKAHRKPNYVEHFPLKKSWPGENDFPVPYFLQVSLYEEKHCSSNFVEKHVHLHEAENHFFTFSRKRQNHPSPGRKFRHAKLENLKIVENEFFSFCFPRKNEIIVETKCGKKRSCTNTPQGYSMLANSLVLLKNGEKS